MLMIFSAVVPVFLVILAGVLADRLQLVTPETGRSLSVFSINVAAPCLVFHIMCSAPLDKLCEWRWWAAVLVLQGLFMGVFYLLERRLGRESGPAVVLALSVAFCNAGFVGLPVVINVYDGGSEAMAAAGLMMVAANEVVIIAQLVLAAWSGRGGEGRDAGRDANFGRRVWLFIRRYLLGSSILTATVIGLLVPVLGIPVWQPLDRAFELLGMTAPAVMLFTMGLGLRNSLRQALGAGGISWRHQAWLCFWRMAGMPLVFLAVLLALDVEPLWLCVTVIMMSTGSAIFASTLAQLYRAAPGQVSLAVALSNMLSIFSLTACLALLTWMGLMPANFVL